MPKLIYNASDFCRYHRKVRRISNLKLTYQIIVALILPVIYLLAIFNGK